MLRLESLFKRLNAAGLKQQLAKCHFAIYFVKYMGHIVSARGIQPNPVKLQAVKNFPRPTKVKELKRFLGLAGYYQVFRRLLPHFFNCRRKTQTSSGLKPVKKLSLS